MFEILIEIMKNYYFIVNMREKCKHKKKKRILFFLLIIIFKCVFMKIKAVNFYIWNRKEKSEF